MARRRRSKRLLGRKPIGCERRWVRVMGDATYACPLCGEATTPDAWSEECGWGATSETKDALIGIALHAAEHHSDVKLTPEPWKMVQGAFRVK